VLERSPGRGEKPDLKRGPEFIADAEVILVSRGAKVIFGIEPDSLLGPFEQWLELVHPDDRPVVTAAVAQMGLQRQMVTYEFRMNPLTANGSDNSDATTAPERWMRETLSPHYSPEGLLDGWDGIAEEITEQRRLQRENQRITGMLQALVANMPTGVFFVQAPGGQPLLVNARARQLLGQREDNAASLQHFSRVYRLFRADGTEYPVDELPLTKALRHGQTSTANDVLVHRPDGRRLPLFTWAAPVYLGAGTKPDGAVWVMEDLTALQQAELLRRESEVRLRAVFETISEGVIVQNQSGVIIEANPAATAILGVPLEMLVGRSWLGPENGCLREDGGACPAEQHPDRLALQIKLPVRNVTLGIPRVDGETTWLLVNSLPLPVGTAFTPNTKGARTVTTFDDITKERAAQRAMSAAKEKYQRLVEGLPVMLWQLDTTGTVIYFNPATPTTTGYDADELGRTGFWYDAIEPPDRPRFALAIQEAAHGRQSNFEFHYHAKNKDTRVGFAIVHPYRPDGQQPGSTWLVLDLTRQRRLEEELIRSQRLELVGRIASGTIHDFKNLLMGIVGTVEVAKLATNEPGQIGGHLETIAKTAMHASDLLSQMLAIGKPSTAQPRPLPVRANVSACVALLKNVLPGRIAIETAFPDHEWVVHADETQIEQIVLNLGLNAREAMPQGGTLRFTLRSDSRNGRAFVVLSVEDTGQGMSAEVKSRIFEPFFTTKQGGTGLGLSIVRDLVERLGGTIEVRTQPEQGTRFEVWLPEH
jgi:PAS domain S-box-containing protein